jgi:ankyrin repeat protein
MSELVPATAPPPPPSQLHDRPTKEELDALERQKNKRFFFTASYETQKDVKPKQTYADLMGFIRNSEIHGVNEWIKKNMTSPEAINEIYEYHNPSYNWASPLGIAIYKARETQRKIGYEIAEDKKGEYTTLLSENIKIVLAILNVPGINLYEAKDLYHVPPYIYVDTPLISAARWELFDVVEAVLKLVPSEYKNWYINEIPKKNIISIFSISKDTALTVSIKTGNYEIVKLLIENGADVNKSKAYMLDEYNVSLKTTIIGREGLTPLILAARGGNLKIVELLLDKGAEINTVKKYDDEDGEELTPLRSAITSLDPAIEIAVRTVLNKRETKDIFDVSFPTSTLLNIFERQQNRRVREILEMLIIKKYGKARSLIDKSGSQDGKNTKEFEDFISEEFSTLKDNQTAIINLLLSKDGIDVITPSNYGTTALMLAASFGLLELVNTLLDKGAEVSAQNNEGDSALVFAVRNGHADVVTALLKIIGTNFAANELNLAIIAAAKLGNVDLFNRLLTKGQFDINAKNKDGDTALIVAVKGENVDIFKVLLLKEGIDVNAQNNDGDTALIAAARIKHKYYDDHEIVAARRIKNLEIVTLLLKGNFDVNAKNNDGDTALHVAVDNNNVEIVRTLLTNPTIDIKIKNKKDKTARDLARGNEMKKLVNPGLIRRIGSFFSRVTRRGGQRHTKKTKKNLKHKKSRRKNRNTHK